MKISINENNEITSYATVGEIDNGIEVDSALFPDNFREEFRPGKFLYIDGEIKTNSNYKEPEDIPKGPSMQDEVDSLKKQVEELTAMLEQFMNKQV